MGTCERPAQEAVATCVEQRHLERLVILDGSRQSCDVLACPPLRGDCGDLWPEHLPAFQELSHGVAGDRAVEQRLKQRRVEELPLMLRRDARANAVPDRDHATVLQREDALTRDAAADTVSARQVGFLGEQVALTELAPQDPSQDGNHHVLVQPSTGDRHAGHPITQSCADQCLSPAGLGFIQPRLARIVCSFAALAPPMGRVYVGAVPIGQTVTRSGRQPCPLATNTQSIT